jgi:four helix bundle protein
MKSDFRDLDVWKKARGLRMFILSLTKMFPDEEKYRLADQMIRASRSITANLAEGYGRFNYQDNIRFCRQARGSTYELFDHIEVAKECEYIDEDNYTKASRESEEVLALLNGYIKYLKDQKALQ